MAFYPALDVDAPDADLVLAVVDEFSPTALEEHDASITIFFSDRESRDRAQTALVEACPTSRVAPRDVDDEDWARDGRRRALDRLRWAESRIAPPWAPLAGGSPRQDPPYKQAAPSPRDPEAAADNRQPFLIVIEPSMGIGTGHHATTRLCVAALQTVELAGTVVLDVGTGSGVLAIAARLLGASRAVGIDIDADAIQSARENLALNPEVDEVRFEVGDLTSRLRDPSAPDIAGRERITADVLVANLTGLALVRWAGILLSSTAPGGTLVLSGILAAERADVLHALQGTKLLAATEEDGWVAIVVQRDAAIA